MTSLPRRRGLHEPAETQSSDGSVAESRLCKVIHAGSTYGVRSRASNVLASLREGPKEGSMIPSSPFWVETE